MIEKDIVYSNPIKISETEFELTKVCKIVVKRESLEGNLSSLNEINRILKMINGL